MRSGQDMDLATGFYARGQTLHFLNPLVEMIVVKTESGGTYRVTFDTTQPVVPSTGTPPDHSLDDKAETFIMRPAASIEVIEAEQPFDHTQLGPAMVGLSPNSLRLYIVYGYERDMNDSKAHKRLTAPIATFY